MKACASVHYWARELIKFGRRQPTNPSAGRVRADKRRRRADGGQSPPIFVFRYAPSREGLHAGRFLEGCRGRYRQCGGYDS